MLTQQAPTHYGTIIPALAIDVLVRLWRIWKRVHSVPALPSPCMALPPAAHFLTQPLAPPSKALLDLGSVLLVPEVQAAQKVNLPVSQLNSAQPPSGVILLVSGRQASSEDPEVEPHQSPGSAPLASPPSYGHEDKMGLMTQVRD